MCPPHGATGFKCLEMVGKLRQLVLKETGREDSAPGSCGNCHLRGGEAVEPGRVVGGLSALEGRGPTSDFP